MSWYRALRAAAPRLAKSVLPETGAEALATLGPELLFSGIGAAMLPPEASLGDRAVMGLGDLGAGLGTSLIGLGLGRKAAAKLVKGVGEQADSRRGQIRFAADLLAGTVPMVASYNNLMPHQNYVYDRLMAEQAKREQAQMQAELEAQQAQLAGLNALTTGTAGLLLS